MQSFEALVDALEVLVDPLEALVDPFEGGPHLGSLLPKLRFEPIEAVIHVRPKVIEALIGPALSHELHSGTVADKELRLAREL